MALADIFYLQGFILTPLGKLFVNFLQENSYFKNSRKLTVFYENILINFYLEL